MSPPLSASTVASDDDLLTGILLRLPIKSLFRFKSVSKRWLSLITDPYFSRCHTQLRGRTPTGLFIDQSFFLIRPPHNNQVPSEENPLNPFYESLAFVPEPGSLRILQSCNGLLLMKCLKRLSGWRFKWEYYMFNPTTKKSTCLPDIDDVSRFVIYGMSFAFDPAKSTHYKVVCVRNGNRGSNFSNQIEMYSSETDRWRESGQLFGVPTHFNLNNGVYWNGSIHWIINRKMVYFNVDTEVLKSISLPSGGLSCWESQKLQYFGECCGHLNLIDIRDHTTTRFHVYEIDREYCGWFVKYSVDVGSVASLEMVFSFPNSKFGVLSLVTGENEDDQSFLLLYISGSIMRYDFAIQSFEKLCHGPEKLFRNCHWFSAYQFIESMSIV